MTRFSFELTHAVFRSPNWTRPWAKDRIFRAAFGEDGKITARIVELLWPWGAYFARGLALGYRENRYQPAEDELIRLHWASNEGRKLLLQLLPHRDSTSLHNRARRLGVTVRAAEWTLAEDKILRKCHPDLDKAELQLQGRSRGSIYNRSAKLRLRTMRRWSKAEDDLIERLAPTHTDPVLASMLGRTVAGVEARRNHLDIVKRPKRVAATPVVADVIAEARARGVKLKTLTRALGCPPIISSQTGRRVSQAAIAKVVSVFGGQLYAEWED